MVQFHFLDDDDDDDGDAIQLHRRGTSKMSRARCHGLLAFMEEYYRRCTYSG